MRGTAPRLLFLMSTAAFFLRIWVVIVLLGRPVNGCLREQEAITRTQAADRACLQSLPRSPVTAMTVVGQADDGT